MSFLRMSNFDLCKRRVLIREDLNVPIENGRITSTQRLEAALPTLQRARDAGAAVMVLSHRGRPQEGVFAASESLTLAAAWLSRQLAQPVPLLRDYLDGVTVQPGQVVLLENCRMNVGEKADDPALARRYAALCEIFVMDAFGVAHRAQASTHGVIQMVPMACAGPLLAAELDALGRALQAQTKPLLAIVGGSKVSTKLTLLKNLLTKVDQLIVGGGIANTFIAAMGHEVGASLYEPGLLDAARQILDQAQACGTELPMPCDVVVATACSAEARPIVKRIEAIESTEMILDIGPQTAANYAERIAAAGTVVWNGPVGVFEFDAFGKGTEVLAQAIAGTKAFSIAGGGDTLAATDKYGVAEHIDYISTGGGAFLEFLEGKVLPAVAALEARAEV